VRVEGDRSSVSRTAAGDAYPRYLPATLAPYETILGADLEKSYVPAGTVHADCGAVNAAVDVLAVEPRRIALAWTVNGDPAAGRSARPNGEHVRCRDQRGAGGWRTASSRHFTLQAPKLDSDKKGLLDRVTSRGVVFDDDHVNLVLMF
jgi:hypothetical protein